jgi:hypothetical protein
MSILPIEFTKEMLRLFLIKACGIKENDFQSNSLIAMDFIVSKPFPGPFGVCKSIEAFRRLRVISIPYNDKGLAIFLKKDFSKLTVDDFLDFIMSKKPLRITYQQQC